jgi:hypothetical protein
MATAALAHPYGTPVYHLINIRSSASGGFEGLIRGPGISGPGVCYWCDSEDELKSLVENLNLSYSTGKEVAHWRRFGVIPDGSFAKVSRAGRPRSADLHRS